MSLVYFPKVGQGVNDLEFIPKKLGFFDAFPMKA